MIDKIGEASGIIWNHLRGNGKITISALQRGTSLDKATMDMGIGWLACQEKIKIEGNRVKKISLTEV